MRVIAITRLINIKIIIILEGAIIVILIMVELGLSSVCSSSV